MASSFRGSSASADFENVLKSVSRGLPPLDEEEASEAGGPHPAAHASFDFLQALDGVSDRQAEEAGRPVGGPSAAYEEAGIEAEPEPHGEDQPTIEDEGAAFAASGEAQEAPQAAQSEAFAEPDLATSDPASLAHELGLRAGLTRFELKRLRRAFALRNHPDRLDPSRREAASRRMKVANALIDAALRRAAS
jgi:hypothetical protein